MGKAKKARQAAERADLATAHAVADWRHHPLVRLAGLASELADQPQLYALSAGTIALGIVRGDRRLRAAGWRMLAAHWLATRAKSAVKAEVDRTRPHVPVEGGRYRMAHGHSDAKPLNSFPSGHTAGATAVARAFASEYPEHAVAAYAAAAAVAAIQVPRCRHYPTDLAAGAAIGLTAGSLVARKS